MLHYAVVFLVIALVAALFGFGGIAAGAVGIAKILFVVFLIMALVTFVMGLVKKGCPALVYLARRPSSRFPHHFNQEPIHDLQHPQSR